MTKRNERARRETSAPSSVEIRATIAGLAEDWEEQNRALYWAIRGLGGDPTRLLPDSPFGLHAPRASVAGRAMRPTGGIVV